MCVILSAKVKQSDESESDSQLNPLQDASRDDPTLADKEAILASLNIKAMTFNGKVTNNGEELYKEILLPCCIQEQAKNLLHHLALPECYKEEILVISWDQAYP